MTQISTGSKNASQHIDDKIVAEQLERCATVKKAVEEKYKDGAPGYYVQTFGCQQNEADSERIAGLCMLMGFVPVSEPEDAKLILVNTCAIREHAEKKALSIIGNFKHIKNSDPDVIIGVGGCMVTQTHRAEKLKMSYPYVAFTFDTGALHLLPELVQGAMAGERRRFVISEDYSIAEGIPTYREAPFKAWLSIMYGCNNFCSYCIVPYVRGRERSRSPEAILEEAKALIDGGARDITLLGQNVNSYSGGCTIAELIRKISAIDGDFTLHFMTSHPKDASDELLHTVASEKKVSKQFHLPVQSGSDRILKAMNRKYDVEKYVSVIDKLRAEYPDISLTTDIIVGFPGETEEDFEATLELLRRVRYDMIFSFIYSPRTGTPAATMDDPVPQEVASERFARMISLQDEISRERNERFIGRKIRALCEEVSKNDPSMMTARSDSPRPIHFKGDESYIGKFVELEITSADTYSLTGKLINNI